MRSSRATVRCSITPARMRARSHSRSGRSKTTHETWARNGRWASVNPAGPAPITHTTGLIDRAHGMPSGRGRAHGVPSGARR